MEKQMIISVSREFGSGGHVIAEMIAKYFGIPIYDRNLLDAIAKEKGVDAEMLEKYDENGEKSHCVFNFGADYTYGNKFSVGFVLRDMINDIVSSCTNTNIF